MPNQVDPLVQEAGVLAFQIQQERNRLVGRSRGETAGPLHALEQQLACTWTAIRLARSGGRTDTAVSRQRGKWG